MALTLDFSRRQDYTEGFIALTKLQHLQDKILPLPSRLQASLGTISALENVNSCFHKRSYSQDVKFRSVAAELSLFKLGLEGHLISLESLKSRSQGILKLVRLPARKASQLVE